MGKALKGEAIFDRTAAAAARLERERQNGGGSPPYAHARAGHLHDVASEALRGTAQRPDGANGKLKATVQELVSINEQLGRSRQELQSQNKQLNTVNRRLRGRIDELERVNNELNSLLARSEMATRERTMQLRALAFELTQAEESERQAIARDLHDDLGQLLSVAKLKLDRFRDGGFKADRGRVLEEVADLIGLADSSVRSLACQLSPAVLHELGLVPALQWLAEDLKKTYGLSVELSDDGAPKPLSQAARAVLFRAIRELLINVLRHAGVSKARVSARRVGDEIRVEVSDGGNGFSTDEIATQRHSGFGLSGVRERMSLLGGSVRISSTPGSGTEIRLSVPALTAEQAGEARRSARKP